MGWLSRLFQRKRRASGVSWEPTSAQPFAVMIGGRRYLSVPYPLAKDAPEVKRLDMQHHLLYMLRKKYFEAPLDIQHIKRILDVGCGTGIWGHTVAVQFPRARVVGLDIELSPSPLAPPPNYHFVRGDLLQGLPFEDQSFDYTHQRFLGAAIPVTRWPSVVHELARVTRPGGYVELLEIGSHFLKPGPALSQFLAWGRALGKRKGIDFEAVSQIGVLLQDAGLSSVKQQTFCVPLGWQKDNRKGVGELMVTNTLHAFTSLKGIMCLSLGLKDEHFDTVIAALSEEWKHYQTEVQIFSAYGHRER